MASDCQDATNLLLVNPLLDSGKLIPNCKAASRIFINSPLFCPDLRFSASDRNRTAIVAQGQLLAFSCRHRL